MSLFFEIYLYVLYNSYAWNFINIYPFLVSIYFFLMNDFHKNDVRLLALRFSVSIYIFFLLLIPTFCLESVDFDYSYDYYPQLFKYCPAMQEYINLTYITGMDGLSYLLCLLASFIITFCFVVSWESVFSYSKYFYSLFFFIEFLIFNTFSSLNLLLFYIFFEISLIPMFLIIGFWGSRSRRIHAAYQFFLYTFFSSIVMLLGIIYLLLVYGSVNIEYLCVIEFTELEQIALWISFFFAFAVKMPLFPFHVWLPEAHSEAPMAGSILLASILLKVGAYGILRFLIPLFPFANLFFLPLVAILGLLGMFYTTLVAIRQIDLKKIIAYSSIIHMNFIFLALFTFSEVGINGAVYTMLSHGITSAGLFCLVGLLYDRYKTRNLQELGSIFTLMPCFCFYIFVLILANIGFPGTCGFIGEFLVLTGLVTYSIVLLLAILLGLVINLAFNIWFLNRLIFGSSKFSVIQEYSDLNIREISALNLLIFILLWFGFNPEILLVILKTVESFV